MEYFFIAAFIISVFFISAYLRDSFLKKYKWRNIFTSFMSLIFFILLFVFGFKNESKLFNPAFRMLLIVVLLSYLGYQVYNDVKNYKREKY